jgi:CheY-like chemotaxis protein
MKTKSVLYVEDNKLVQETVAEILESDGHQVTVAGSVAQALELLEHHQFDLVLLDYTLVDETSEGVIHYMKSNAYYCTVPIIVMSGDLNNSIANSLRSSIDAILIKPVDPDKLCFTVSSYSIGRK